MSCWLAGAWRQQQQRHARAPVHCRCLYIVVRIANGSAQCIVSMPISHCLFFSGPQPQCAIARPCINNAHPACGNDARCLGAHCLAVQRVAAAMLTQQQWGACMHQSVSRCARVGCVVWRRPLAASAGSRWCLLGASVCVLCCSRAVSCFVLCAARRVLFGCWAHALQLVCTAASYAYVFVNARACRLLQAP